MAVRATVIYYSATGTVRRLADAVVEGAEKEGAEVRLRRATETAPAEAVASRKEWQQNLDDTAHLEPPTHDDLRWADVILIGSPTRYGNISTPIASFLETTGPLWFGNELADKVVGGFTSVGTQHGGHESTLLALSHVFHHWGAIYVPAGYVNDELWAVGNPYGVSAFAPMGKPAPSEEELAAARSYGRRVARIGQQFVQGREAAG